MFPDLSSSPSSSWFIFRLKVHRNYNKTTQRQTGNIQKYTQKAISNTESERDKDRNKNIENLKNDCIRNGNHYT